MRIKQGVKNESMGGSAMKFEAEEKASAMVMLQRMTDCPKEQINKLQNGLSLLLEKIDIRMDD